jgi:hypothetical protein
MSEVRRIAAMWSTAMLAACGGGGSGTGVGPPVVTLSLSSPIVPLNSSATLTWTVSHAESCTASFDSYTGQSTADWSGTVPTSGTLRVPTALADYDTYTLDCTGHGASSEASAVLTVAGPTPAYTKVENSLNDQFIGVGFNVPPPNQIVGFSTTVTVPTVFPTSTAGNPLFIWPGLEPAGDSIDDAEIGLGVLQPVLGWGPSCGYATEPAPFESWWLQPYYDNVDDNSPLSGCSYGKALAVAPGDVLTESMTLDAATGLWTETLTDSTRRQTVVWSINLRGEGQNYAEFLIEAYGGDLLGSAVTFTDTTITFQNPDTSGLCSSALGAGQSFAMTPPTAAAGGKQCAIAAILLDQRQATPATAPSAFLGTALSRHATLLAPP